MDEFYTVPNAIIFRNTQTLGNNQFRTLLLQNRSNKELPVFVSLPFTQYFTLECHAPSQEQTSPACIVSKIPPNGSVKVVVKLHLPPAEEVNNLHDMLVAVFGTEALPVPVRAVRQQMDPIAAGEGLQALLSQLPFIPPHEQLDASCNAFVVELASQLQLELSLRALTSSSSLPTAIPQGSSISLPRDGSRAPCLHGSRAGNAGIQPPDINEVASCKAGLPLPPETFSKPMSSSSSEDESPSRSSSPGNVPLAPVPQLEHQVIVKGRSAVATCIIPAPTVHPPPGHQLSAGSAQEPEPTPSKPSMAPLLAVPRALSQSAIQQAAAHAEASVGLQSSRSCFSDSQGSDSSSPHMGGLSSTSCGDAGGAQACALTGPVFLLGSRYYNARGEEVELPSVQRSSSLHEPRPAGHVSALGLAKRSTSAHDPPPVASRALASAAAPSPSSAICPTARASIQHELSGCLTQLELPHLPNQVTPRPPIYGACTLTSTSSMPTRVAPPRNPLGSQDRFAAAGGSPRHFAAGSGKRQQAAPARPAAAAQLVPARLQELDRWGGGGGPGTPRSMKEDVEGSLVCALESHIAQHLAGDTPSATHASPCSASRGSSCGHADARGLRGASGGGVATTCRGREPVSRLAGHQPDLRRPHPAAGTSSVRLSGRGGAKTRQRSGKNGASTDGIAHQKVPHTCRQPEQRQQLQQPQQQQQGSASSSLRLCDNSANSANDSSKEGRGQQMSRKGGKPDSESDGEEYAEELARMIERQACAADDGDRAAGKHTCRRADLQGQQVPSSSCPQLPAPRHAAAAAAMQRVRNAQAR